MITQTEPRQLLGYGQHAEPHDYTPARLDELAEEFTPAVKRVQDWARRNKPHSELRHLANKVRAVADELNERIDRGMDGGTGGSAEYGGPCISKAKQDRVNLENQAKLSWASILGGYLGPAERYLQAGLKEAGPRA